jgi:hypothetical protein
MRDERISPLGAEIKRIQSWASEKQKEIIKITRNRNFALGI